MPKYVLVDEPPAAEAPKAPKYLVVSDADPEPPPAPVEAPPSGDGFLSRTIGPYLNLAGGAWRGLQDITDTGLQGAAWGLEKLGGEDAANWIRNNIEQSKGLYERNLDTASPMFQAGRLAGNVAGTYPVAGIKALQGTGAIASGVNNALQGGLAAALLSSQSDLPLPAQVGGGALVGAVVPPVASRLAQMLRPAVSGVSGLVDTATAPVTSYLDDLAGRLPVRPPAPSTPAERLAAALADVSAQTGTRTSSQMIPQDIRDVVAAQVDGFTPDQILRRNEIESLGIRPRLGAVTAEPQQQMWERTTSKTAPELARQFEDENAALVNEAKRFVERQGGITNPGAIVRPEETAYHKGATLQRAYDALSGWYDQRIGSLYGEARRRAQGLPAVDMGPVQKWLDQHEPMFGLIKELPAANKELARLTSIEGAGMGELDRLVDLGKTGKLPPLADYLKMTHAGGLTVDAAETFRQRLNQMLTQGRDPRADKFIGELKRVLDDTVTRGAGDDVFSAARSLRAERARRLEDPKALNKLFGEDGHGNKLVPVERMAESAGRMSVDELAQLRDVLVDSMPTPELRQIGEQAWNEIRTHGAERLMSSAYMGHRLNPDGLPTFSAPNYAKALNQFGPEKLNMLFEDSADDLARLSRVSHYLAARDQNPSGTATTLVDMLGKVGAELPGVGRLGKALSALAEDHELQQRLARSLNANVPATTAAAVRKLRAEEARRMGRALAQPSVVVPLTATFQNGQ